MKVRNMSEFDFPQVKTIYRQGIETGHATFEILVPEWENWHLKYDKLPGLVMDLGNGKIAGWTALSSISGRAVYNGVADISIYILNTERNKGFGKLLLYETINYSEQTGIWTLQAGIFPENSASQRLFRDCGFRLVGIREKIGKMEGMWRDVLLYERRSRTVGT